MRQSPFCRTARSGFVVLALLLFTLTDAGAQTPHVLAPFLTNELPLTLSGKFGVPVASVANDDGDFAFIGNRGTGLYYRPAGAQAITRVIQNGDEVSGLPGSRLVQLATPILMNSSGVVAVRAEVYTTNRITGVIFRYDGATLSVVVTGFGTAPGTGGLKFERAMTLVDLNGSGDILFGSTLLPLGSLDASVPTVFLAPASGPVVRVAGPGDASPGTGGTVSQAFGAALNDSGQVLLTTSITGVTATSGIFAWTSGSGLRKVVAYGDVNPLGGTFTENFTTVTALRLSNSGLIVFVAGNSLWQNTEGASPETSLAAGVGTTVPAPMNGTISGVTSLAAFGHGGDAVFQANVSGGSGTLALFRFRPGDALDIIARQSEAVPGGSGKVFGSFTAVSVNAAGTVSFQGTAGAWEIMGIFQKPRGGVLGVVVANGAAAPADVGGTLFIFNNATQTLADDSVVVRPHIMGAADAFHAHFIWKASPVTLMSTADALPPGASRVIRPHYLTGAGTFVGFAALRAGGRESVGVISPTTQAGDIVGTEGNLYWGGRVIFSANNTIMVSSAGHVVVQALSLDPWGGGAGAIFTTILAGGLDRSLEPVLPSYGFDSTGTLLLTSPQLANPSVLRPVAINASGTVAFTALGNNLRGVFIGSQPVGGVPVPPTKVAMPGDTVSLGATTTTITNSSTAINSTHGGINASGKVLFTASTSAGVGLFVATAGSMPVKVVQAGDPAPGGGTFTGFGTTNPPMPGFNDGNQVAFVASVSGGGGIFLATPTGPTTYSIDAVALHGAVSPAGGTFAIAPGYPDVVINNAGDVLFMADLAGGPADSGLFLRRAGIPALETVALQGQSAPGTTSTFQTFQHTRNIGERIALSQTAQVAFFGGVMPPGGTHVAGWWHREPDGDMQPIMLVPSTDSAFEGGTSSTLASMSAWLSNDRIPMFTGLAGGTSVNGMYLWVPAVAAIATNAGANVTVSPVDPLTGTTADVTFATITSSGETRLQRVGTAPPLPRGWWYNSGYMVYYKVTTTASYTGSVEMCFDFGDQAQGGVPAGAVIRMLHYEGGQWVDVTSAGPVGTYICGQTSATLSLFVAALALNDTQTNILQNGDFAAGPTGWQVYATDGTQQDNSYIVYQTTSGMFEYYRVPPPSGSNQAVVLQNTAVNFAEGDQIVARFDLGNSSSARKRISVLIHASDWSDLAVCTFWLPPITALRPYAMRTHTTKAWTTGASISFYAASPGPDGGFYQVDNVVMGAGNGMSNQRTDCVDPDEPGTRLAADTPELLTNGSFASGLASWTAYGTITAQVTGGVAEFIRPSNTAPAGALLQPSGDAVGAGETLVATFELGNSSASRKRITVILHDLDWGDLAACTFWLVPGQPLMPYIMRAHTTQAWPNATISFYPATTDTDQWFELDNVSLKVSPSTPIFGTDCVEPGGDNDFNPAPAPAPGALAQTAPGSDGPSRSGIDAFMPASHVRADRPPASRRARRSSVVSTAGRRGEASPRGRAAPGRRAARGTGHGG